MSAVRSAAAADGPAPHGIGVGQQLGWSDRAILEMLERDGRTTLSELAAATGLSTSTVHAHRQRLIDQGVLRGYRAVLDHAAMGRPISALIRIALRSATVEDILTRLASAAVVESCYRVTGAEDLVLVVHVESLVALDRLRRDIVAGTDGVTRTELVLASYSGSEIDCASPTPGPVAAPAAAVMASTSR